MADSIREQNVKHFIAALASVKKPTYQNDIDAVLRIDEDGQKTAKLKNYILIAEGDEQVQDLPSNTSKRKLPIEVAIIAEPRGRYETRSAEEILNSLRADVEKAAKVDRKRGGNAINTRLQSQEEIAINDGQPRIGTNQNWIIEYMTRSNDPYTLA